MNLIQNLNNNYVSVYSDWVGFSLNFLGIGKFFLDIFIASGLFIIFYLFGDKIRKLFFNENKKYTFFVNIALGYILIGTGIGVLGAFSLLKTEVIWVYLISIIMISLYPFQVIPNLFQNFLDKLVMLRPFGFSNGGKVRHDWIKWAVLLFVLIAILRLMTPEITEDGYHTDLPRLYLSTQTTIHETRELLHVIPYPQLAEMIYIIPIFLGDKDATRFIHFGFYLLIIFLLFAIAKNKKNGFVIYAPVLFVTAPIMIRYSPSQYVDFFMVFSFLLSLFLIEKNIKKRSIILSGIILGAIFSIKMWTLVYMPAVLIYLAILNWKSQIMDLFKIGFLFMISALSVPLLWYVRSFIITGNPIYPIFTQIEYLEVNYRTLPPSHFGINANMFSVENMIVYSPLFFFGILLFLLNIRRTIILLKHFYFALFFIILMVEQLIVKVDLGRYLVAWYTSAIVVVSAGVSTALAKSVFLRYLFIVFYLIIFSYYFMNTVFMLPYGLGWADENKYLTRVLGRDNANYYDFDRLFNKWISDKDLVATHGIVSYYYAEFHYIDVGYIFSKENRSFDLLKKRGVTKLLVKGGSVEWFCEQLALTNCDSKKVRLLATWPTSMKKYNLYSLVEK